MKNLLLILVLGLSFWFATESVAQPGSPYGGPGLSPDAITRVMNGATKGVFISDNNFLAFQEAVRQQGEQVEALEKITALQEQQLDEFKVQIVPALRQQTKMFRELSEKKSKTIYTQDRTIDGLKLDIEDQKAKTKLWRKLATTGTLTGAAVGAVLAIVLVN